MGEESKKGTVVLSRPDEWYRFCEYMHFNMSLWDVDADYRYGIAFMTRELVLCALSILCRGQRSTTFCVGVWTGGVGWVTWCPADEEAWLGNMNTKASTFQAESRAILAALEYALENANKRRKYIIVSDSLDSLKYLQFEIHRGGPPRARLISRMKKKWLEFVRMDPEGSVNFQWVKRHKGIQGNVVANSLARIAPSWPDDGQKFIQIKGTTEYYEKIGKNTEKVRMADINTVPSAAIGEANSDSTTSGLPANSAFRGSSNRSRGGGPNKGSGNRGGRNRGQPANQKPATAPPPKFGHKGPPQPKFLSKTPTPLTTDALLQKDYFIIEGDQGFLENPGAKTFTDSADSLLALSDRVYRSIVSVERKAFEKVPASAFDYYNVIQYHARIAKLRQAVGSASPEEKNLLDVMGSNENVAHESISAFLTGLGDFQDPSGTTRKYRQRVIPRLDEHDGCAGFYGQVNADTYSVYENYPSPGVAILRVLKDVEYTADRDADNPDWDLPIVLRPAPFQLPADPDADDDEEEDEEALAGEGNEGDDENLAPRNRVQVTTTSAKPRSNNNNKQLKQSPE
ncbi:unnamed protein product [Trichogramma brassicae]|uniref:RNase H type-1 domain-containing protein n=1 Tax=Trichogramma brassicae TaxID=86971 RepID=A0A6H5J678_9HYME|nr:unnamed protein product [Trichogramma brassicae]